MRLASRGCPSLVVYRPRLDHAQLLCATLRFADAADALEPLVAEGSGCTARCMALSWVAGALSVLGRDDDARAAYRDLLATPDKGRVDKQGGNRGLQCHFNLRI